MLNRRIFKQERNTEIADNIQAEVKLMLFCTNLDPTTTSQGALAIISYTIQNESGTNTDKIDNKIFITHQNNTMTTFQERRDSGLPRYAVLPLPPRRPCLPVQIVKL